MSDFPLDDHFCMQLFASSDRPAPSSNYVEHRYGIDGGPLSLGYTTDRKWEPGQTLTIRLMNPNPKQRMMVEHHSKAWLQRANLKFDFVESGDAQIRVAFNKGGSNSYVGRDALNIEDQNEHTMNFGWLDEHHSDTLWARTIMHEFGHALGCVHEHQISREGFKLDIDAIIKARPGGWSEAKIMRNYCPEDPSKTTAAAVYDPYSIMHYDIPARWILNNKTGLGVSRRNVLSELDLSFIAVMYPSTGPNTGRWQPDKMVIPPGLDNQRHIPILPVLSETPVITAGLTAIGASWRAENPANIRLRVKADDIRADGFNLHLDSWSNCHIPTAGATWLVSKPNDPDCQVGTFNTMAVRDWFKPTPKAEKAITFAHTFAQQPLVVVWINWIDSDAKQHTKIKAYAKPTTVTTKGFNIHIDSWDDSRLFSAGASWIAYTSEKAGVYTGVIETKIDRDDSDPLPTTNTGYVNFPKAVFNKNPTVLMAVCRMDFDKEHDLSFKTYTTEVTPRGMRWHLDLSGNSVCRSLNLSFLALE